MKGISVLQQNLWVEKRPLSAFPGMTVLARVKTRLASLGDFGGLEAACAAQ
jgi:hypothetical protein